MKNTAQPFAALAPFNVAVFASGRNLVLVHLEDDPNGSGAAEATARGYQFIGSIGVNAGVPKVECEPTELATVMMPYAGVVFAELFRPHLRAHQLQQASRKG